MTNALEIHGALLTRNTMLNLAGQVIPLLVGLATIPYVVRGLGTERFGILSIAWVLLGYFSLFDLGLGRATTYFVAECFARGEIHQLPGLVWASTGFQVLSGVAGGLLVGGLTPFLVSRVLKIPTSLVGETKNTFLILAWSLPLVLASNSFRGVLEAGQRFDLINYIKIPANISVFLLPAIALPFGLRLPGIVLLLVLARLGSTLAHLVVCLKVFPVLRHTITFSFQAKILRPLLTFGGWLTISNVVSPLTVYMDRFVIGSMLSLAAVGYYSVPYEAIMRLSIIPASLSQTIFPAFSNLNASGSRGRLVELYTRSVKFVLLVMGPLIFLIILFGRELLRLWLGANFASNGTRVLQVLACGVLVNAVAFVPSSLLQGIGRADLTAKYHLLELPLYLAALWLLVGCRGIVGAALASALRLALDATLLFGGCFWLGLSPPRALRESGLPRVALAVLGFGGVLATVFLVSEMLWVRLALVGSFLPVFLIGTWNFALDQNDRTFLSRMGRLLGFSRGGTAG